LSEPAQRAYANNRYQWDRGRQQPCPRDRFPAMPHVVAVE
jgi:hypothetical protein